MADLCACPACGGTGTAPGTTWCSTGAGSPPPWNNCRPCRGSGLVEVESMWDEVRVRPAIVGACDGG